MKVRTPALIAHLFSLLRNRHRLRDRIYYKAVAITRRRESDTGWKGAVYGQVVSICHCSVFASYM